MKSFRPLLVTFIALCCAVSVSADLSMTLSPSVQNSARGRELVFSGTLTNTSSTAKLFLNDIAAGLSGSSAGNLVLEPNSFFANVPGILQPGESYSDSELFRIILGSTAPADDYGGTVTLRGGADILANGDLDSAPFTVLSPAISVVATDASASEFGPDPGVFTISRSGSTTIDLPVYFAISGTALNGIAYNAITPALTIPAGSSAATITISPIPNNLAEGDRTTILSLGTSLAYNLGATLSDNVTIHDKPADAWRFQNFGPNANDPAAADGADWEGDGIANLIEFALALDPKASDRTSLPSVTITADYLTISYLPNAAATDVNYIVEASTTLSSWSNADVEPVNIGNPNPPSLQTFRYKFPVGQSDRAFLRLRVERTDL